MSKRNFSKAHSRLIQPGQLWDSERYGRVRVMAVVEGYAMARCKGAVPFVVAVKDMDQWRIAPIGSAP